LDTASRAHDRAFIWNEPVGARHAETKEKTMLNRLLLAVEKSGFLTGNLDYYLIRASMVIIFLLFGYQKWFEYEAQVLIPFIDNGPLISWLYPVFGIRGGSVFLGVSEWIICLLLFWGIWNRSAGILGALGSCATFVATVTIIPFMPDGWDQVAGGFPAMTGNVPFLMKDVVLLAASFYLLKQDVVRAVRSPNGAGTANFLIKHLAAVMNALGLLREGLEYYVLRLAMVIVFAFFGYTKWHPYAPPLVLPFVSNSPFIFWLIPAFGIRGAIRFLGASDWTMFALLYAGFWDRRFGALGALGATGTFITTVTIIPFMPDGWDPAAGFPAMAGAVPFLVKDVVLLAVAIYLLKQDLIRLSLRSRDAGFVLSGQRVDGMSAAV
jgi:uncharacterized membrane protein YkgB